MEEDAIRGVVRKVQDGWNAGSGERFAEPFAEDADYVIVNAVHVQGREAIGVGHQQIFDTVYKGSNNTLTVEHVRFIRPDVAIAHVLANLKFNPGGGPQEASARSTWVLTKEGGEWRIAAFHNTPLAQFGE